MLKLNVNNFWKNMKKYYHKKAANLVILEKKIIEIK